MTSENQLMLIGIGLMEKACFLLEFGSKFVKNAPLNSWAISTQHASKEKICLAELRLKKQYKCEKMNFLFSSTSQPWITLPLAIKLRQFILNELCVSTRGHSKTTWTRLWTFLEPPLPYHGQFYLIRFIKWCRHFINHLPQPYVCPCGFWMAPYTYIFCLLSSFLFDHEFCCICALAADYPLV